MWQRYPRVRLPWTRSLIYPLKYDLTCGSIGSGVMEWQERSINTETLVNSLNLLYQVNTMMTESTQDSNSRPLSSLCQQS
ncbi:hypothetical protein CHS0354_039202 [Potamilus streckersoni]|uniref:Uncharacterized protein n=1 Tax=Potamilus streckersoni TaxID=2493646 RepID=A0AAE0WAK0_9BIVA|nr:hypothetical protein CHS0354_039202 [Potamilus streckersoni]